MNIQAQVKIACPALFFSLLLSLLLPVDWHLYTLLRMVIAIVANGSSIAQEA